MPPLHTSTCWPWLPGLGPGHPWGAWGSANPWCWVLRRLLGVLGTLGQGSRLGCAPHGSTQWGLGGPHPAHPGVAGPQQAIVLGVQPGAPQLKRRSKPHGARGFAAGRWRWGEGGPAACSGAGATRGRSCSAAGVCACAAPRSLEWIDVYFDNEFSMHSQTNKINSLGVVCLIQSCAVGRALPAG